MLFHIPSLRALKPIILSQTPGQTMLMIQYQLGLKYCLYILIKYFYYYLLLPSVPSHTVISCIRGCSHQSCSTFWPCPCVQGACSCNSHPCGYHAHVSSNIYQNIQALDNEAVLGEVQWKEQGICWFYYCHLFHIWRKEVTSIIDYEQELAVEFLQLLLQLVVQDLRVGSHSPYLLGVENPQKGGL